MTVKVASAIKLGEAYFCLNCELVTNFSDICPVCGHAELWSLEKWLGRVNSLEDSMGKVRRRIPYRQSSFLSSSQH
jgi:RNA polymerase subunit RPABC4/transcription elongation factor Spt4